MFEKVLKLRKEDEEFKEERKKERKRTMKNSTQAH
jgi:hypothetical protein